MPKATQLGLGCHSAFKEGRMHKPIGKNFTGMLTAGRGTWVLMISALMIITTK